MKPGGGKDPSLFPFFLYTHIILTSVTKQHPQLRKDTVLSSLTNAMQASSRSVAVLCAYHRCINQELPKTRASSRRMRVAILILMCNYATQEKNILHKGSVTFNDIIEVARVMRPRSCAKSLAGTCKEILGTAVSVGCKVDQKHPSAIMEMVSAGHVCM